MSKEESEAIIKVTENDDGTITIDYDEKHPAFAHLDGLTDDEKVAFFTDAITKGLDNISNGQFDGRMAKQADARDLED